MIAKAIFRQLRTRLAGGSKFGGDHRRRGGVCELDRVGGKGCESFAVGREALVLDLLTTISSRFGKTPTLTSPSSSKLKLSTRSCIKCGAM